MSTTPDYMQSLLQLYKGANNGGTQGAQSILSGAGKLVGSTSIAPDYQSQLQSTGNTLGSGANALGIYNGVQQGGVTGYGGAAINAANLAGRTGALPTDLAKPVGSTANDLSSALGIYSGIKQGGVAGDSSAAINAAKLGSNLGAFGSASGQIGQMAGYAAVPLSIYNEINNWQSGATGQDALGGAESGAAIGSLIVPGIGTVVGGLIGGAAGALSSVFGNGKVDPENQNFEGYTQAYNKADPSQQQQLAMSVQNPYLPLAGYFDLRANQMKGSNPIYQTYGRMGEQNFTNDLASQVSQAKTQGVSEQDMMSKVVQPWIDSMGNWQDSNKNAMEGLINNMTDQIYQGTYQQNFKAVGGDSPFAQPQKKAAGGSVRYYDDGGGVNEFGDSGDEVTVTAPSNNTYDWSDYSPPSIPITPITGMGGGYNGGVDNVDELSSVQNALSGSSGSGLSSLLSNPAALAALLGGGLVGASGGVNMTANYNPQPPQMFNNTGPIAAGNSQYGNFTAQPRQQLNPTVNYAHGAEQPGGVPLYYAKQQTAPSPLATGLPAASSSPAAPLTSSPVASGPSAPAGNVLQQPANNFPGASNPIPTPAPAPQQQIPAPIQNAIALNHIYGGGFAQNGMSLTGAGNRYGPVPTKQRADGGLVGHSDGVQPLQMGMQMAAGTHVRGPGDGTSDDIPAMLSDGEYVIPAHVVSALGNGSNDAGAKMLDQFQDNIRRKYGVQMASGKHPARMKNAEKYIK